MKTSALKSAKLKIYYAIVDYKRRCSGGSNRKLSYIHHHKFFLINRTKPSCFASQFFWNFIYEFITLSPCQRRAQNTKRACGEFYAFSAFPMCNRNPLIILFYSVRISPPREIKFEFVLQFSFIFFLWFFLTPTHTHTHTTKIIA